MSYANAQALADTTVFIAEPSRSAEALDKVTPEAVAFDKADEAASLEELRKEIEVVEAELLAFDAKEVHDPEKKKAELDARKLNLIERLKSAEESLKDSDRAERANSKKQGANK